MRIMTIVAAVALIHAQAAPGAIFENQLHTGFAGASFSPPTMYWQDVTTRVTGEVVDQLSNSFVRWDIGILEPTVIRLRGSGFANIGVTLENTMTVTLTEASPFTLTGTMTRGGGAASVSTRVSGPGITGVPLQPDGSLLLSGALGTVSLSGTLLPGEYTIVLRGNAFGGGFGSGQFGANLALTVVPAPAAAMPALAAIALAARRRRG